ncbi:hypothetical protein RBB50_003191 [Rhinocladiella similis]
MSVSEHQRYTQISHFALRSLLLAILWILEAFGFNGPYNTSNAPNEPGINLLDIGCLQDQCIMTKAAGERRCRTSLSQKYKVWRSNLREILLSTDPTHLAFRSALKAYIVASFCHNKHIAIHKTIEQYMTQWNDELVRHYKSSTISAAFEQAMIKWYIRLAALYRNLDDHTEAAVVNVSSEGPIALADGKNVALPMDNVDEQNATGPPNALGRGKESSTLQHRFKPYLKDDEALWNKIIKGLSTQEEKSGYIYIFRLPKAPRYLKIGSSKHPTVRVSQWKDDCNLEYEQIWCSDKIRHALRLESILQIQLGMERQTMNCFCGITHNEWFEISLESAREVVEHWIRWLNTLKPYGVEPPHRLTTAFVRLLVCPDIEGDSALDLNTRERLLKDAYEKPWFPKRLLTYDVDYWNVVGDPSTPRPQDAVRQSGFGMRNSPRQQASRSNVSVTPSRGPDRSPVGYVQSSETNTPRQPLPDIFKGEEDEIEELGTPPSSRSKRTPRTSPSVEHKKSVRTEDTDPPSTPARSQRSSTHKRTDPPRVDETATRDDRYEQATSMTPSKEGPVVASSAHQHIGSSMPTYAHSDEATPDGEMDADMDTDRSDDISPARSNSRTLEVDRSPAVETSPKRSSKGKGKAIHPEWGMKARREQRDEDGDGKSGTLNEKGKSRDESRTSTGASPDCRSRTPRRRMAGSEGRDSPASSNSTTTSRSAYPRSTNTTPKMHKNETEHEHDLLDNDEDDDESKSNSPLQVGSKGKGKGRRKSSPMQRHKKTSSVTDESKSPSPTVPLISKKMLRHPKNRPGPLQMTDNLATKSDSALVGLENVMEQGDRRTVSTPNVPHFGSAPMEDSDSELASLLKLKLNLGQDMVPNSGNTMNRPQDIGQAPGRRAVSLPLSIFGVHEHLPTRPEVMNQVV